MSPPSLCSVRWQARELPDFCRGQAVKVLRKGQGGACDIERQIMWEVHVLTMLHHSHIVKVWHLHQHFLSAPLPPLHHSEA